MSADFYIGAAYFTGALGIFGLALQGFLERKKLRLKLRILEEDNK